MPCIPHLYLVPRFTRVFQQHSTFLKVILSEAQPLALSDRRESNGAVEGSIQTASRLVGIPSCLALGTRLPSVVLVRHSFMRRRITKDGWPGSSSTRHPSLRVACPERSRMDGNLDLCDSVTLQLCTFVPSVICPPSFYPCISLSSS